MDTKVVEVNKNIFVGTSQLNNASSFSGNINVEFIPDVMIVKSMIFSNGVSGTVPGAYLVTCNIVPSCYLGTITENVISATNMRYIIKKPVSGTYNFNVFLSTGESQGISGYVYIHLEFIKYKQIKEQKVY